MAKVLNTRSRTILILLVLLFAFGLKHNASSQENYFYRVSFTDKGSPAPDLQPLTELFTLKAVARREKNGITVADFHDLPVNEGYLGQVKALGLKLKTRSRWMNSALFTSSSSFDINTILDLPFVKEVKLVKHPASKSITEDKLKINTTLADPPSFDRPLTMLSGTTLHESGYKGKDIVIAVLDAGFIKADYIPALAILRYDRRILGTYDFVKNSEFVYNYHNHGTAVLSILAGIIPQQLNGSAPGASYWLLRTEDGASEFPVEEDYWAAGAEYADSVGADIISSSLGYYSFDDLTMDYKFSEMDGNTTYVTRAADIAASRGILVVASAGNERNKPWKRIIAPSDGDSVLAIGAVDGNKMISTFSSAGPSSDRRVKPDVSAQGVSVAIQTEEYAVSRGSGTSFSCPVVSGLSASVMQAFPLVTAQELADEIRKAGDRFATPDSLYGYGIPDFGKIVTSLQDKYLPKPESEIVIGPNPTTGDVMILFRENPVMLRIRVHSISGTLIATHYFDNFAGREFIVRDLTGLSEGVYVIHLETKTKSVSYKVIKAGGI